MSRKEWVTAAFGLYILMFAGVVQAREFFELVLGYDGASLMSAFLVALIGGLVRTTITLVTPGTPIWSVFKESWRDLAVALMAGGVAHLVIEAVRVDLWSSIGEPTRLLFVFAAGAFGFRTFAWFADTAAKMAAAATKRATAVVDTPESKL